jgi:hypothetical protein
MEVQVAFARRDWRKRRTQVIPRGDYDNWAMERMESHAHTSVGMVSPCHSDIGICNSAPLLRTSFTAYFKHCVNHCRCCNTSYWCQWSQNSECCYYRLLLSTESNSGILLCIALKLLLRSVLLDKLIVTWLIKTFSAFYRTWRFISVFIRDRHRPRPEPL